MSGLLALDIGGSAVKHALFTAEGALIPPSVGQFPVESDAEAAQVTRALAHGIAAYCADAASHGLTVAGIGVSIPGPFDYAAGTFRMRHKYPALYGFSLRALLAGVCPEAAVGFLHDGAAFLLGEAFDGAGQGADFPCGVTLGTGIGFACMDAGRVLLTPEGLPALSLWGRPFHGGIIEDALSSRGIVARYQGRTASGGAVTVADIAQRARNGDAAAQETMVETGTLLAEAVGPYLDWVHCDRLVIGGRIAHAADLFLPQVNARLGVPAVPAAHIGDAALRGVSRMMRMGREKTIEARPAFA